MNQVSMEKPKMTPTSTSTRPLEGRKKEGPTYWINLIDDTVRVTLNYRMSVERYPNPNEGFGSLILGCEIFSLLDGKTKSHPSQGRQ